MAKTMIDTFKSLANHLGNLANEASAAAAAAKENAEADGGAKPTEIDAEEQVPALPDAESEGAEGAAEE